MTTLGKLVLTDNDRGEITVTLDGKEIRGWSYKDHPEHLAKMLCAREYCEGWYDGTIYVLEIQMKENAV